MNSLQAIDIQILKELLKDGRRSFAAIAKNAGVSSDVIYNHFMEMEKAGIVVGATIQYNYPLFGYQAVALILIRSEAKYHEKIIAELGKNPELLTIPIYNSIYNISIVTIIRSLNELDDVKQIIKQNFPVETIRAYLWTEVRNFPEHLNLGFFNEKLDEQRQVAVKGPIKLDELDLKIIDELNRNGRAPFALIAKTVNSSTDTVNRRYKRLVKNNLIKVCLQINPLSFGYKAIVHFLISLSSQEQLNQTIDALSKIDNISFIVKISGGDYDLFMCLLIRDFDEIFDVSNKIRQISNVEKFESYLRKIPLRWPTPKQFITSF
jgi:Lrp/AsnC family transcriptional regulator for asnA, asnC and gidA